MMRRITLRRILCVSLLVVAHAAALSGGVFFHQQAASAQEEMEVSYGKMYLDSDGHLIACDCTKSVKECACKTQ